MPSLRLRLRRTVSESVSASRLSPYPSSLSLSAAGALNAGLQIRPRRVASETSGRRVLADIEWWRILDGQHEEGEESASGNGNGDENENDQNSSVADLQPALNEAMQESFTPTTTTTVTGMIDPIDEASAVLGGPDALQGASSLTTPFSALSISPGVPITPPMTPPRSRNMNALHSPSWSAVSTPESSPRTPPRLRESLFMDSPRVASNSDYDEEDFCPPLPPFLTIRGTKGLRNLTMMRSVSFGGFDHPKRESEDERFGDVFFV